MRRIFAVCLASVAAAGFGVVGAVPAGAAGSQRMIEGEMHVAWFDVAVAEAHGYEIRTNPDGTQYSVSKGAPTTAVPMNVVTGNCGRSWVWEDGIGHASVRLTTGFHVRKNVAARSWRVQLEDNGGVSTQPFSGGSSSAYWDETRVVSGLTRGPGYAVVKGGGVNFAVLTDGAVCFSGGPSASTTIY